jgi:serine phosphatase RsbU (regulator of sigma subunit)
LKKKFHITIFILLITLFSKNANCQQFSVEEQHEIDSLFSIIDSKIDDDTLLVSAYVNLSQILYIINIDTLSNLSEEALAIIDKTLNNNPSKKVKRALQRYQAIAISNIGYVHKTHGEILKALECWNKTYKIQKEIKDKDGLSSTLNNLGYIYKNQGDIEKALTFYHESLMLCKELKDRTGEALSYNNIGLIYYGQKDIEKALEYCHHSLKIRQEINNKNGISQSLNNIGVIYDNNGLKDSALVYFKKSLSIRKEIGDKKGTAASLQHIGKAFCELDSIDKGLAMLKEGLRISIEIDDKLWICYNADVISSQYLKLNKIDSAEFYANLSMGIAQKLAYPDNIERAAHNLFEVYRKQKKYKDALEMYMLKIEMRDSINNENNNKATIRQQTKYEYEKQKTIDDAENYKLIVVEQEAKEKQRLITFFTAALLALVILLLFFVMNRLQHRKKQKIVIEEAHLKLEEKTKEILDSISYAKRIQLAILPPTKTVKEHLKNSFILYIPKDVVAGDFYWMETISSFRLSGLDPESPNKQIAGQDCKDVILFAVADCTGHGVPGAMVSVICNNALNRSVREHRLTDPGKILDKTREIVIQEFEKSDEKVQDGMDIALCSLEGNQLYYAGAHNPLWIIREGTIIEIKADKQPIGKFENPKPFTTHAYSLIKGDTVYLFSDGYVDQFGGEKGKKFKSKAMRELLLSIQDKSMVEQKEILNNVFENWKGNLSQIDDICMLGFKFN